MEKKQTAQKNKSTEAISKTEEKIMKEVEKRIARIMAEKDGKKSEEVSENEKKEMLRNEEYVEIKLFKDNEKYVDDVYVAVGNQNCVIKRGVPVKIKRKFYLALMQSDEQDFQTAQLIEKESGSYKGI